VARGPRREIVLWNANTSNAGVVWCQNRAGPWLPSPLLYRGYVYVLEARQGMVSCYDAKTGEPAYAKQRLHAKGFTASPWAYEGKIFCLDQEGQTFVLNAVPKFELLATNKLDEAFSASPAVAGNDLLLRGVTHLYCIKP
jgi:outer membrane protein assembly factor BamB